MESRFLIWKGDGVWILLFVIETKSGFYNVSYSQNSGKVSAIALCRGEVKPDTGRGWIVPLHMSLMRACPN